MNKIPLPAQLTTTDHDHTTVLSRSPRSRVIKQMGRNFVFQPFFLQQRNALIHRPIAHSLPGDAQQLRNSSLSFVVLEQLSFCHHAHSKYQFTLNVNIILLFVN